MATLLDDDPAVVAVADLPDPTTSPQPELVSDDGSPKQKRRSKFTPDDDIILIREVAAIGAHVAPHGQKGERYNQAAIKANKNPRLSQKVTAKSLQDRYLRLQKDFDEAEKKQRVMSGIGGEVGEMEELLSEMAHAREDMVTEKEEKKQAFEALEARKVQVGELLVNKASNRAAPGPKGAQTNSGSSCDGSAPAAVGKGRGKRNRNSDSDEFAAFNDIIRDSEAARLSFQRDELSFRDKRLKLELEDREREREERRKDREEHQRTDLDKFKLMMEAQTTMIRDIVSGLHK